MNTLQSVLDFPLLADRKLLALSPASSTAVEHNPQSNSYNLNKATLDSDLVVISAALFCTLVCALGLNSLLKCALRSNSRVVLQASDHEMAISLANTGLKKEAMTELPIIVCTATSNPPAMSRDCPICLGEFVDGEKLRLMPKCSHSFHMECIDQWFFSNSSCPVCRHCLNLHSEDAGGAVFAEAFESNNAMHVVIID